MDEAPLPCQESLTPREIMEIIVDRASDTIAILDEHGVYQFINAQGAKRFGMTPDQVRGKSLFDLFEEADARSRLDHCRGMLADGQSLVFEVSHVKPDGQKRWYRSSVQPFHDEKGNATKVLVISADITESKLAQEALRESQTLTAALLNASGDRAVLCDINGTILAANQTAGDAFGMSPQKMISANLWELLPKELAASRRSHLPPVLAGKSVSFVDERYGTILASFVHPIPDSTGRVTRMAIFGRDITTERRAVAALEQNEERLRSIVSSLHDTALVVYDRQGVCQSLCIDPALDGVFGPKSTKCVGKSVFDILPADAAARRMALIDAAFANGASGRDEYSTPPGLVFEASVAPMRDADGDVVAAVCFVLDVTKRTQAQEALRQAHNQLMTAREQERQGLSRELHDSIGQGMIVLDMAIKNAILNCRKQCPAAAKLLNQASEQSAALIREVRAISHGLYPATLESLGLVASLRQLAHDCAGPMLIEVKCDPMGETRLPPQVEIALYRIAQEAVQNAVRHSYAHRLDIHVGSESDSTVMQICDDGTGFQAGSSPQGGMGIENMKARAQAVGGQLIITSRSGCTSIVVRVPKAH